MARQRKLPDGMWKLGDAYYARFRAGGREIRKRLSIDYKAACEILNDLKARADRGDFGLTDNDYAWADLKREFLDHKQQTTRNPGGYEGDLKRFEEYCPVRSVRQIDHRYVYGFREWRLAQGRSPRTINMQVGILKDMLNVAVEWGRIGSDPIAGVKDLPHDELVKQRRSLTLAEVDALTEASPAYLLPIWWTLLKTGMRKGEIVELRFSDVDFDRKVLTVQRSTAKNHKAREIPLDDDVLATIAELERQAKDRKPVKGWTVKLTKQQHANFTREHVFVTQANTP